MRWFLKSKQHKEQDRLLAYLKKVEDELIEHRQTVTKYLDPLFRNPHLNEEIEASITKIKSEVLLLIRLVERTVKEERQ